MTSALTDTLELYPNLMQVEPIWPENKSKQLYNATKRFFSALAADRTYGSFWCEWYQGFLDGKPMDWELQRRVALIDDAIWEAGPEAVAKEIARIRAAFEVETCASELEESAGKAATSIRGIGDNNPPSPIDEALKGSDGVTITWAAAQELKEQAQSDQPDKRAWQKPLMPSSVC